MSNLTSTLNLHRGDDLHVDCEEQGIGKELYAVLHIGDITIFPEREHLVAIRDAIQGYLDAHPIVITPAEIVRIAADGIAPNIVAEFTDSEVREMF